jgi:hypothetical protein
MADQADIRRVALSLPGGTSLDGPGGGMVAGTTPSGVVDPPLPNRGDCVAYDEAQSVRNTNYLLAQQLVEAGKQVLNVRAILAAG